MILTLQSFIDSLDPDFWSWACKWGSVAGDESVFSREASLVFRFRAATWAQTSFFESPDR
jgi:hypothetical protein